jgi:predicted anti-sigma-YlaC factor YlaD
MLTCQQVLDYLSDYLEGVLPPGEAARLDEHLAVCPQCVDYLTSFKATLAACRTLRSTEFAKLPTVPEELVQAILAARRSV